MMLLGLEREDGKFKFKFLKNLICFSVTTTKSDYN